MNYMYEEWSWCYVTKPHCKCRCRVTAEGRVNSWSSIESLSDPVSARTSKTVAASTAASTSRNLFNCLRCYILPGLPTRQHDRRTTVSPQATSLMLRIRLHLLCYCSPVLNTSYNRTEFIGARQRSRAEWSLAFYQWTEVVGRWSVLAVVINDRRNFLSFVLAFCRSVYCAQRFERCEASLHWVATPFFP